MNRSILSVITLYTFCAGSSGLFAQIDFTTQVQPIFTNNCTDSACHDSDGPQQGMDLTAGNSYNNIVNVAATGRPNEVRVTPGSLSESYLYRKLTNDNITGSPMPFGNYPLPTAQLNIIRDWITEGALVSSVADSRQGLPNSFALSQNYPNPFNPSTLIRYSIAQTGGVAVNLSIYNLNGQNVKTLVNSVHQAGEHQVKWDGTDDKGNRLGSGIYLYRLTAGNRTAIKKMSLLR
jgi:hypothetical protein